MSFSNFSEHTARKEHRCDQCGARIEVGSRYMYGAYMLEGQFTTSHEHFECRDAWNRLNFGRDMRDLSWYEGAPFLCDDGDHESGDREWMWDEYPIVAARLGWAKP